MASEGKRMCKYLIGGLVVIVVIIVGYRMIVNNEIQALELDASYYECEEGTMMTNERVADVNDGNIKKYLCYVTTGIKASCPMDVETKEMTNNLGNSCVQTLNQILTNIRGENTYFYMPVEGSAVKESTTLNQACLDRNYVHTEEDDTEYYGYYKTACVCYGSLENVAQCGSRQWLNKELSDDDYRYYIATQDEMTCDNGGTPIVIGNDPKKGDLYACSLGEAQLIKREVTLNFSFSGNDYTKSSMSQEFKVANDGELDIYIEDDTAIDSIYDAGYELDKDKSICKDIKSNVYGIDMNTSAYVVDGSELDESVRFIEDITCDLVFKKRSYSVNVSISDESTGTGKITSLGVLPDELGNFYVTDGGSISVDAISNDDSKYVSTTCESVGGSVTEYSSDGIKTKANIAFSNVKNDIECSVTFEKRKQYAVKANVVEGKGTVNPSNASYYEGAKPIALLTPGTGYAIDSTKTVCDNDGYSISGSNIVMTKGISSNVNCDVYFKTVDYNVVVTPNPSGGASDISVIYNNDSNDTSPNYEDVATVRVVPNEGYVYTGNTCGNNGSNIEAIKDTSGSYSFDFTVLGNKSCEVRFSKNTYEVKAEIKEQGYIGAGANVKDSSVLYGESTSISVVEPIGYSFDSENTVCSGNADINKSVNPISISNVKSDVNCSIAFKPNNYSVDVSVNDANMGSVEQTLKEVTIDDEVIVTIKPNDGYEYVENNCGANGSDVDVSIGNDGNLLFKLNNISSSLSCQVTFAKKKYSVNASVNPIGSGDAIVDKSSVEHGGSTSIALKASSGYEYSSHICKNSSNMEVVSSLNTSKDIITIDSINDDISCIINYGIKEYSFNASYTPINSVVDGSFKVDFDDDNNNGKVKHGDNVFITYQPIDGYSYSSNTCGAREYSTNQLIVENINSNIDNCVVNFVENAYKVSADVSNGGNIEVEPISVGYNGSSTIKALAIPGYVYDSEKTVCSGNADISKESSLISITNIKSDIDCDVAFKLGEYNVNVLIAEDDDGAGSVVEGASSIVNMNDSLKVVVSANENYEYDSNTCGINNSNIEASKNEETGEWSFIISNVTSNKTCYVNFKKIFRVSASAVNGKIDSLLGDFDNDDGTVSVYENKDVEIGISPNENYQYVENDCGAIANSDNSKLTITNINEDKVCKVYFEEKNKHSVSISTSDSNYGTVTPDNQEVYDGNNAEFELEVTDGNEYLNVTCNDKIVSNAILTGNKLVIPNVKEDLVCLVNFKNISEYTVIASSSNEKFGKVTPDSQSVNNGGSAVITLVPSEGYQYESNNCGAEFSSDNKLTLKNITSNKTCIVDFKERDKYSIEVKVSDDNAGSAVTNDDFVYSGEDTTIVVVPNVGYEYESNDCGATYNKGLLTLTNVTSNKVCTVKFKSNFSDIIGGMDNIDNVPTGDNSYIIYIICLIGGIGMLFGYKKYFKEI